MCLCDISYTAEFLMDEWLTHFMSKPKYKNIKKIGDSNLEKNEHTKKRRRQRTIVSYCVNSRTKKTFSVISH